MKSKLLTVALTGALLPMAMQAAIVEFYDFENGSIYTPGVAGPLTATGQPNGSGYVSGLNGTRIYGWNDTGGAQIVADASPNGGSLALSSTNQDGYMEISDTANNDLLNQWTSPSWTLEMHARIDDMNGWETLMARMGTSIANVESDLYFQRRGDTGQFRMNYLTNGSTDNTGRLVIDSTTVLTAATWYGIAVVADGTAGTLTMYIDQGAGYAQEAQLTGLGADLGWQPASAGSNAHYAFFRDYFNGGQSNVTTGVIDNFRVSDTALTAGELIPLVAVPEPSSFAAMFGAVALLAATVRRRKR